MTHPLSSRSVKLSLFEYDDVFVPFPLFAISLGLMTSFTYFLPLLVWITLPIGLFIVFSFFTGDVTLLDADHLKGKKFPSLEEE